MKDKVRTRKKPGKNGCKPQNSYRGKFSEANRTLSNKR